MGDPSSRELDAHAAAFAQILATTDDAEVAFRQAAQLADGLFAHQVEGVAFLLGRKRAILADDMGLGRLRQAIGFAAGRARRTGAHRAPCRQAHWAEIACWRRRDHPHHRRHDETACPSRCALGHKHDILGRHVDAVVAMPWAGLVFDEAHYLKNHTSARSKLCA